MYNTLLAQTKIEDFKVILTVITSNDGKNEIIIVETNLCIYD
jgi:hypothetical protein